MAKKKTRAKLLVRKLFGVIFLSITIVCLLNIAKQVLTTIELTKQKEMVEEELQSIRDENDNLTTTKTKLEDPDYVQTYARGEYMFSKEDEKVFYLPEKEDTGE